MNTPINKDMSNNRKNLFITKVLELIEKPYFRSLSNLGIDDFKTQKIILSKLYNNVTIESDFYGFVIKNYDGNIVYLEDYDGHWSENEYDHNGKRIYSIDSFGMLKDERLDNINESLIDKFIEFAKNELSLPNDFKINLTSNNEEIETLANYDIKKNIISVKTKNRAIPDIIRSIAHEMTHHKQKTNGDLKGRPIEGEDGSPWEDQANAKSGELVRKFGRINPEIYDL